MAKRRGKRRYSGLVSLPGLGFLNTLTKGSVSAQDALVGAGAGMAGALVIKALVNKFLLGRVPAIVLQYFPLVGSLGAGAALYYLQKKKKPARAKGHLIGAAAAGIGITTWDFIKAKVGPMLPMGWSLDDYVSIPGLAYGYGGGNYSGVLIDNPSP